MSATADSDLAQFMRRFRPALMSFFLRRVRNYTEAEDLTQETLIRLSSLAPSEFQSAEAYLFRTAKNLLVDRARRNSVRQRYLEEHGGAGDIDVMDPARITEGRHSLARLAQRLSELPERPRIMFTLYRIEGMKKPLIAKTFRCSVSTVEKEVAWVLAQLIANREDAP